VETPSRGVCFEHAQNKRRHMAFSAIAQRLHSVAGVCTARTSVFCNYFKRCMNAVRTPLWCDRGFKDIAQQC